MKCIGIFLAMFLNVLTVENKMLPINYMSLPLRPGEPLPASQDTQEQNEYPSPHETVLGLKSYEERDNEDSISYEVERRHINGRKKPCSIVVLSNIQNPTMQSLLRKYRYDANGILIPSSVQYFIKLPQGMHAPPLLLPLNDRAFSPLGGFVRYYKEVPPIPQSWQN